MNLDPLDTSPEAREHQAMAYRRMGAEGRFRAALELSEALRAIRFDGLRAANPEASESQLIHRYIFETHGISQELMV